jgi:hypothetical protein
MGVRLRLLGYGNLQLVKLDRLSDSMIFKVQIFDVLVFRSTSQGMLSCHLGTMYGKVD